MKFILIILSVFLFACSSEWHPQKAISKDISILEKDTVIVSDSVKIVTEHIELDSVFMISKDTVTIVKDNLTIRHFYHNDSVYIYAECDSTIQYVPFEIKVPVDRVVYRDTDDSGWAPPLWVWLILFLGLLVWGVEKYFKHKSKKSVDSN